MYNEIWGKAAEAGEFSKISVIKVNLQCVRLLLTVTYKKLGQQDVLVVPPIILLEPRFTRLSMYTIIEHVHEFHRYKAVIF